MLFNAYAPSSYFVFTHHSQDFHYNTFYLFHNLVILSFYVFITQKLRAFVFCCILMRSKYTLKGQILDTGQEFAPFYEKEVSEAQFTELVFEVGCKNIFSHIGSNFV